MVDLKDIKKSLKGLTCIKNEILSVLSTDYAQGSEKYLEGKRRLGNVEKKYKATWK